MSLLLLNGNAREIPLADESVHCVVTSPPYWGLRDYGIGDQLGLEPTPEQYIENMVAVFREVKRVLRADGTAWINMGDSYNSSPSNQQYKDVGGAIHGSSAGMGRQKRDVPGLKPKDLCGIPWRLAFALQADGWWLRSDIIWSKPNPMPESVTDRPTKAHEYVFLMTKSARYYYDQDAIREPQKMESRLRLTRGWDGDGHRDYPGGIQNHLKDYMGKSYEEAMSLPGRNKRTVWEIPTRSYSGAHFATYPPALVEPCIKAGTSERGVCPECGAPWERVVERSGMLPLDESEGETQGRYKASGQPATDTARRKQLSGAKQAAWKAEHPDITLGWRPTCKHDAEPIPATVFDPFAGSGTTLQVARALGRSGVGLDLSAEYLQLARQRLELDALDAWESGAKKDGQPIDDLPLFEGL